MRNSQLAIHLFARRVAAASAGAEPTLHERSDISPRWDAVPLVVQHGKVLHLDDDARACDVSDTHAALSTQIVPVALTPRVALRSLRGQRVFVNGCRAPSLAIARAGDEIALEGCQGRWRLHVSALRPVGIGPAGHELSGRECPLCLGRFSAETRVFRCGCGSALHVAQSAGAAGDLDCARAVSQCPDCRRAIVLASGYEELPRDDDGRDILPADRSADVAAGV